MRGHHEEKVFTGIDDWKPLLTAIYDAPVAHRLELAVRLHRRLGAEVAANGAITTTLTELRHRTEALNDHMQAMALGAICTSCAAEKDRGGCCSSFMAGETDAVQLWMNMLAGIRVAADNEQEDSCCYLGLSGCIFAYKPMFCLNYNCHRICSQSRPELLGKLLELSGRQLRCQYRLEQLLLHRIKGVTSAF